MPKFKDWKPGECRAKVELITDKGACVKWYLPHLEPDDGLAVAILANNIATVEPEAGPSRATQAMLKLKTRIDRENSTEVAWNLKPEQIQTVHIQQAIGVTVDNWKNHCYEIACAVVESGLVDGRACYGMFLGNVAEDSGWDQERAMHRHGWIELEDGRIFDPTRWCFESAKPYIWLGENCGDYDEGANVLRSMRTTPCRELVSPTAFSKASGLHDLELSPAAAGHLWALSERKIARNAGGLIVDIGQCFWIANLPYVLLEPHNKEVYLELARGDHPGKVLVPIDNWKKAMG
jgi:hypothetical protein